MDQERRQIGPARRIARVVVWMCFAAVLFVRFVFFKPEPPPSAQVQSVWRQQEPRFYRPPTPIQEPVAKVPDDLPRFEIEIAPRETQTLRDYFWNGWRGRPQQTRPEVLATVRQSGQTYTNVALHLKGAAGSFRGFDDKPALTLNFHKNAPGQRAGNYSKLSLNNSVQDPSYLCEMLAREIFEAAGVPVPQAEFATVVLNGRDLGVYVLLEGYNKDFLRRHFRNVKGNLYDGGFCQEVNLGLSTNSGDHPEDRTDLERLLAAAEVTDDAVRWTRLNQTLDVDRFVTMVALEVLLCHWDGYSMNRNNYRLFHDAETDRMVFMPHGLDQLFDYPPGRFPSGSIKPNMRGVITRAVLSTAEGGQLFAERLVALKEKFFKKEALLARVAELAARLRPTLMAYSPSYAQWHDASVASLSERISRRIDDVTEVLSRPREMLEFDASGVAPISDWPQRFAGQGSGLQLDRVEEDGKSLLRIAAANRGATGSWRAHVNLKPGRYRLEGRVRVSASGAGSRVCLRVSGSRPSLQQITTTDWVSLSHPFQVDAFSPEVILVCEFSGVRGEAWFDAGSLRLVKDQPLSSGQGK